LFRSDGSFEKCTDLSGRTHVPEKDTPTWPENIDCDLYLYDGPPKIRPIGVKMIAFTSPNLKWLDSMEKNPAHRVTFMPVWNIGELQRAVETLELKIDDEVLEERFEYFGGSARYCLSTDLRFVLKGRDKVNKALGKIQGFDMVEDCLMETLILIRLFID
jgi:hypothetical protein